MNDFAKKVLSQHMETGGHHYLSLSLNEEEYSVIENIMKKYGLIRTSTAIRLLLFTIKPKLQADLMFLTNNELSKVKQDLKKLKQRHSLCLFKNKKLEEHFMLLIEKEEEKRLSFIQRAKGK